MVNNRRKQIVVNSDYQYRAAKSAVSITVLAMNILLLAGVLAPQYAQFQVVITQTGAFVIAGVQVSLFVGVWYGAIRASHRVAGPIYAFTAAMEKVERGDLTVHVKLREKDEFKEFAHSINKAISSTRIRLLEIKKILEAFESCSDANETQHSITELRDKANEFTLEAGGE